MKTTAAKFKKNPQKHYRAADLGETVTINHDRYPDKIFEMTARNREPLKAGFASKTIKDIHVGDHISLEDGGVFEISDINALKSTITIWEL